MISQDQWGHILRPWSGDRLLPSLGSELRLWYRVRVRSGFYDELRLAYDLWIAYRCVPVAERCQQTTIGFQICQKISFRATSNHTNDKAIDETECATNLSSLDIQDLRSWDYPNPLSSFCHRAINSRWHVLHTLSWNLQGNKLYLAAAIPTIPAAYGCVQLGALSIIFPTEVERFLWKSSCLYLIGAAAVSAVAYAVFYLDQVAKDF